MNENIEKRTKTDVNFRSTQKTRRRIHHALKVESISSTKYILAIDIGTHRQ